MKAIILLLFVLLAGCANNDSFAQCLTDNDATMYGTEWCSHCQNQKKAFGSSFESVNYVDCDKDRAICEEAGIEGYPTWIIDGKAYPGEQKLETLAMLSECELNG